MTSSKMNLLAQLDFELGFYGVDVNHYPTEVPSKQNWMNNEPKANLYKPFFFKLH